MSDYIFSFIGCGNMGGALARAAAKNVPADQMLLCDKARHMARALADDLRCAVGNTDDAAGKSDYIFLGVKPQMLRELMTNIAPVLARRSDHFVLVSMAAGVTISQICEMAGKEYPVIRIMPNIPCAVGEGMILFDTNDLVTPDDLSAFLRYMSGAGMLDQLDEHLIDAGSAVSGCGPAFVSLFIEALADGGVTCGLPRQKAMMYARQMVAGSARLLAGSTFPHPGSLKDAVCSPGGSTIEGVRVLEQQAFRGAVTDAVVAAFQRTKELGK